MLEYQVGEIFRLNEATYRCVTDYVRVTEPEEGMLFRATNGVLYELKLLGSTPGKCGCDTNFPNNLSCHVIDAQAFGKTQMNSLHWYPVEEKREEEKMEEKKRHIELAVTEVDGEMVTFYVAEQTHRGDDFTPGGIPFESRCGLTLKSVGVPAALTTSDTMYVRGRNKHCDKMNVTVSALRFAKIMQAITEYNETNGRGYKKLWPQNGDICYFVSIGGLIDSFSFPDDSYGRRMKEFGNLFRTYKEGEAALERVKAAFKDKPVQEEEE